ncbi:MAG: DUF3784 domain-containing protein [Candidatus Methanoplasma sp.]|nr:DUF3784 domain-containing protein [Candidatus Methanoplasma sp.]
MIIEERKRETLVMCIAWMSVPIVFAVYVVTADLSYNGTVILSLMVCSSCLLMAIGVLVYLGFTGLLAGFNTMSPDELRRYNMKKVSSFMGLAFVILAFVLFFGALPVYSLSGGEGAIAVFFVTLLGGVMFISAYMSGKRFKNKSE